MHGMYYWISLLYCTLLDFTLLYCTVLHCTILYCTTHLRSPNIPHQGQCPCPQSEITCKLEWKPVCDTRGKTHANMCEAYKAGALVDHHGQCSWNPCGR